MDNISGTDVAQQLQKIVDAATKMLKNANVSVRFENGVAEEYHCFHWTATQRLADTLDNLEGENT